jgi:hypothetical protein
VVYQDLAAVLQADGVRAGAGKGDCEQSKDNSDTYEHPGAF